MLVFGWFYVFFFIPETRGLSLEEVIISSQIQERHLIRCKQVDEMYRAGIKPWQSEGWKPHLTDQFHEKQAQIGHRDSDEKHTTEHTPEV